MASFVSASLTPALPAWNLAFPGSPQAFDKLITLVSVPDHFPVLHEGAFLANRSQFNILLLGLGNIFWVPFSNIFGRRPALVLSSLILVVSSGCGTSTEDFKNFAIIRAFQGVGSSVSETVAVAMVGDMFFIYDRGTTMVCSNMVNLRAAN